MSVRARRYSCDDKMWKVLEVPVEVPKKVLKILLRNVPVEVPKKGLQNPAQKCASRGS